MSVGKKGATVTEPIIWAGQAWTVADARLDKDPSHPDEPGHWHLTLTYPRKPEPVGWVYPDGVVHQHKNYGYGDAFDRGVPVAHEDCMPVYREAQPLPDFDEGQASEGTESDG